MIIDYSKKWFIDYYAKVVLPWKPRYKFSKYTVTSRFMLDSICQEEWTSEYMSFRYSIMNKYKFNIYIVDQVLIQMKRGVFVC
jgi:hypothetical protein